MKKLRVLIACEESQRVCAAFRELGHEAYSCDIQVPSGGHPEWHINGDVTKYLNPTPTIDLFDDVHPLTFGITFYTMDGEKHHFQKWDLIIAHPPCTYLSNAGACRLYPRKGELNQERYEKGLKAKRFFMQFLCADCEHIAVENPIPSKVFGLPKYDQIIQPYQFGEPFSKKTCLWLRGLPELKATKIVTNYKPYVSCGTSANKGNKDKAGVSRAGGAAKVRSKTFPGIARAMAEQWGKYLSEFPKNT